MRINLPPPPPPPGPPCQHHWGWGLELDCTHTPPMSWLPGNADKSCFQGMCLATRLSVDKGRTFRPKTRLLGTSSPIGGGFGLVWVNASPGRPDPRSAQPSLRDSTGLGTPGCCGLKACRTAESLRTQVSPETPVWHHCLSCPQCAVYSFILMMRMHSGYQPVGRGNKFVSIAAVCGVAAAVALAGFTGCESGSQSQAPTQMYTTAAVRTAARVAPAAAPLFDMTRGARPPAEIAQTADQESMTAQFGAEQVIAAPATSRVAQIMAMMGVASIAAGAVILFCTVFQNKQSIAVAAQISKTDGPLAPGAVNMPVNAFNPEKVMDSMLAAADAQIAPHADNPRARQRSPRRPRRTKLRRLRRIGRRPHCSPRWRHLGQQLRRPTSSYRRRSRMHSYQHCLGPVAGISGPDNLTGEHPVDYGYDAAGLTAATGTVDEYLENVLTHARQTVPCGDAWISVDGQTMQLIVTRDQAAAPWKETTAEIIIEGTGAFNSLEGSSRHIDAGAKQVVITAPATSCRTNTSRCLSPEWVTPYANVQADEPVGLGTGARIFAGGDLEYHGDPNLLHAQYITAAVASHMVLLGDSGAYRARWTAAEGPASAPS